MKKLNNTFTRRDFFKGLGAAGILSSLQIEQSLAQTTAAPVRVVLVAIQHGWGICNDTNRPMIGADDEFSFPDGLDPFNSIKQHATVVDGVLGLGEWGNNHDLSYADIFTAGVRHGDEGSSFSAVMPMSTTPSLDYLLQEQSAKPTYRFSAGYTSWGLAYHPISFDRNSNPLPFHIDAIDAYNSLFRDLPAPGNQGSPINSDSQLTTRLFDSIRASANVDLARLSANQQGKLNNYISAVNDLNTKNQSTLNFSGNIALPDAPTAGQNNGDNLKDFLNMVTIGFANELTDSAVVGIGELNSIPDFHHSHAHEMTSSYWDTRRINAQYIVDFVNELSNIEDVDGNTLLDNTIIVLTGEVAHGEHNVVSKGHILFGGGGRDSQGQLRLNPGRLVKPELLNRVGVDELMREDVNGVLQQQIRWTNTVSTRTNADLLREVGNLAGLNLSEFGLPSQNRGDVL